MTNKQYLIAVMQMNGLERKDIQAMLGIGKSTISCWLNDPSEPHHREIKDHWIDLLRFKLKERHLKVKVEQEREVEHG